MIPVAYAECEYSVSFNDKFGTMCFEWSWLFIFFFELEYVAATPSLS